MALAGTTSGSFLCRLPHDSGVPCASRSSLSFASQGLADLGRRRAISIHCSAVSVIPVQYCKKTVVLFLVLGASSIGVLLLSMRSEALTHLNKIRSERNEDLCLRIGVKLKTMQNQMTGSSNTMAFKLGLLFLYGMQLDFSDALIGGSFSFKNFNATKTCGCGKSFASGASGN